MADDNGTREKLGAHGEAIANLKEAVEGLQVDVKALTKAISEARGGWKAMTIVGAAAGGLTTAVLTYLGLGRP